MTNGLSPFARSAFADNIRTGTPPSPLFGANPFTQTMPRLKYQPSLPLTPVVNGTETEVAFPAGIAVAHRHDDHQHLEHDHQDQNVSQ